MNQHYVKTLCAVVALTVNALAATDHAVAQPDPFGPAQGVSWTQQLEAVKPHRLVIACAESDTPPPANPSQGPGSHVVTPEFIRAAKVITVAVGDNDTGAVSREDDLGIKYQLSKKKDSFALDISVESSAGGDRRQVQTYLTIPGGEWLVIGVMAREEVIKTKKSETTRRKYYTVAVKIDTPEAVAP